MAELTEQVKAEIVRMHAQFVRGPEIIKAISEEFGVALIRQQVAQYHPERATYSAGDRWREEFKAHRRAYMEEITSHDIASPAYRIGMLDRMAKKLEAAGNMKGAAEMLEQAAKEVGGAFTNERKVSGTIDHRHRPATAEDARAELAERLKALQVRAAGSGQDVASSGQGEHGVANSG